MSSTADQQTTIAPVTEWTEAQKRGITTVGRSLLVSAAAGSGKTSVLVTKTKIGSMHSNNVSEQDKDHRSR